MILSIDEVEKILLGGVICKEGLPVSVSRETVDFYKGEYKISEIVYTDTKTLLEQGYFFVHTNQHNSFLISENYPTVYKVVF